MAVTYNEVLNTCRGLNVSNALCCFARIVAAGILRIPRCGRVDPHFANNSGDLFGGAPRQTSLA